MVAWASTDPWIIVASCERSLGPGIAWHDAVVADVWSEVEVDHVIDVYFSMLKLELAGERYKKSDFRSRLLGEIDRSSGSAEYKFQNISAVIAEIGGVFIDGYKPARNVQALLRQRVVERFLKSHDLRQQMLHAVEAPAAQPGAELADPEDAPEIAQRDGSALHDSRVGRWVDYQQREASNRALGLAGEEAVVRLEQRRLLAADRPKLAEKVRHVSILDGDGLGFDVLSFTPDGIEQYLEVKTTRYSPHQPFFVSRSEVDFSATENDRFTLVRLFRFESPRTGFFELRGSLRETADLRTATYVGVPRTANS